MKTKIAATGIVIVLALGPITQGVAATIPSATKASLVFMVEEEKFARDVYTTLYAKIGLRPFANINKAEQTDGSISLVKALDADIAVEKKDIADIDKILKVTQPADVKLALDRLMVGSYNHLAAFTR